MIAYEDEFIAIVKENQALMELLDEVSILNFPMFVFFGENRTQVEKSTLTH
ncbi:MAG: hypothetical protein LBV19_09155 [Streptococcaceae bacterium]|jgi:hypothetical protein|nr:hypothetical protein [Streptococcaceae bacterium]